GFEIYANGIIAREDTLKNQPDLVRKFVRASVKGLRDALNNPAETAKIMAKHHRQVEPEITEGEIKMVGKIAVNDLTKQHGLGYIDEAKMQKTIDLVGRVFKLKRPIKAEEVFVSGFIPGIK
ncbi:MAG: ABC transporter substrate-binding protein, partial [Methyloligellaceae bacterium]